ncbi:acetyl-CoA carboxylase biotin carboxyl carrier protein [Arthrobacter sp. zg-Y826]|uniref:acetyl-CoA carboxylase biotin carboxyl carrier protein n=1 Tax=Arthrobacter jinronghuae TaxID=2964609 RepID=UPI00210315E2|nr:acetyl-CoA carboxylase biotin carboxyl carrier protein [Arthrobacter jinronghuae]MCQ1957869.1 acetyl-CoA carboxylase biotin carboxyl carrier protein [Arthrobacter jinronghuae]
MTLNQPNVRELKSLVEWVNVNPDVRELSIKYGDVELFVSRNERTLAAPAAPAPAAPAPVAAPQQPAPVPAAAPSAAAAPAPAAADVPSKPTATPAAEDEVVITAPMVGTFYSSPKPGAPAFVNVGQRVSPESVLGILEVMKLMNNVEATVDGVVTEILVENNQAVEFGQPMMVIKRDV